MSKKIKTTQSKKAAKPNPLATLRDVDRTFIQAVMFELGIVPIEKTAHDMRRALNQLPPEEARAMKRKFRKLWRKAIRSEAALYQTPSQKSAQEKRVKTTYGVGKQVPSRNDLNNRKKLVFDLLWENVIGQMVYKFENPEKLVSESTNDKKEERPA